MALKKCFFLIVFVCGLSITVKADVLLSVEQTGLYYATTWSYNGSGYVQGSNATASQAAPIKGLDYGDFDNSGNDEILMTYRTSTSLSVVRSYTWDKQSTATVDKTLVPGWSTDYVGVAIGDVSSNNPGNEIALAYQNASNSSWYIIFYDQTDVSSGLGTSLGYTNVFSGWSIPIQDIALGDVDNDGTMNMVVAYQQSGSQVLMMYDIGYDEGESKILTSNAKAMFSYSDVNEVMAIGIGDADNDGDNEIILGLNANGTKTVTAYNVGTGAEDYKIANWTDGQSILTGVTVNGIATYIPEPASALVLMGGSLIVYVKRRKN